MILSTPDPFGSSTLHQLQRHPLARPRPALFVDPLGTLIEHAADARLRLLPGAGAALARLQRCGLAVVILVDPVPAAQADVVRLQQRLPQRLQEEFGVHVDAVETCPHSAGAAGRLACRCRKPAAGMLVRAAQRHGLDLARSWMVGDTLDDVEAGHRAGAQSLLFDSGGETAWRRAPLREPDARFFDWPALGDYVEKLARAFAARPAAR